MLPATHHKVKQAASDYLGPQRETGYRVLITSLAAQKKKKEVHQVHGGLLATLVRDFLLNHKLKGQQAFSMWPSKACVICHEKHALYEFGDIVL